MSDVPDEDPPHGCALAALSFVAGLVLGCLVAGIIGLIVGETRQHKARYEEERSVVSPELTKDPAFNALTVNEYTGGGIWLSGHVPTAADKERLRRIVTNSIGARRASMALAGVEVDLESRH
jgi:hypothetical protein